MKEGNSYSRLLSLIKTAGYNRDVSVLVGQITKTSPLTISFGDWEVEEEDFAITNAFKTAAPTTDDKVIVLIDGDNIFAIDKVV